MDHPPRSQSETSPDNISEQTYTYRPRMLGAEFSFRLAPQFLEWSIGRRAGRTPYSDIRRMRLSYRPSNFAGRHFLAEIWTREGLRLSIASVSARSLFDFDNRGPAYRDFVADLSRRIAASGAPCRFEGGFPAWRWWPAIVIGNIAALATLYLTARMMLAGEFAVGTVLTLFGLFFGWQIGSMIVRNRPIVFVPPEVPRNVIPSN